MDPIPSPISTGNGVGRLQTWQARRLKYVALDQAVAEPHRVFLPKRVVEPDIVLVLVLSIGIRIERVTVKDRVERTSGRQYALKERDDLRLNVPWIITYRNLVVQVRCTRETGTRRNSCIRIVDLLAGVVAQARGKSGCTVGTEVAAIHGCSRNQDSASDRLVIAEPLIGKVEECIVLQRRKRNWTADSPAELVLMVLHDGVKRIL